jgi:hypothetical protein
MPGGSGQQARQPVPETRLRGRDVAWSAIFIAAALVGALAGAGITHMRPLVAIALALIVALIPVALLFNGKLNVDPRSAKGSNRLDGGRPAGGYSWPATSQPDQRQTAPPPLPAKLASTLTGTPPELSLQSPPPAAAGWWRTEHEGGDAGPTSPELAPRAASPAPRPPAAAPYVPERVDLSHALIAQCPNCGSFRLDGTEHRHGRAWELTCLECPCAWTWRKGDVWPAVHVRPEVRELRN